MARVATQHTRRSHTTSGEFIRSFVAAGVESNVVESIFVECIIISQSLLFVINEYINYITAESYSLFSEL